jgi:hypothetical protein
MYIVSMMLLLVVLPYGAAILCGAITERAGKIISTWSSVAGLALGVYFFIEQWSSSPRSVRAYPFTSGSAVAARSTPMLPIWKPPRLHFARRGSEGKAASPKLEDIIASAEGRLAVAVRLKESAPARLCAADRCHCSGGNERRGVQCGLRLQDRAASQIRVPRW